MQNTIIEFNKDFVKDLNKHIQNECTLSTWELFKLNYFANKKTLVKDFHTLQSLPYLKHMQFLPHQLNTANRVIQQMHGRAILADEVGLGKTIEAGLIMKEYMVRGLVEKILILVPASLINQWTKEMNEKFFIPAVAYRKNIDWKGQSIIVASIDTAKRSPHAEEILKQFYDFVIIDEAHRLKNEQTINYQFVRSIQKKYCLLLTATPVQNKLLEVFNLVSILKPGLLGSKEKFKQKFNDQKQTLENNKYLKRLIKQVMVRHTRKEIKTDNVKRNVRTIWLHFSKEEKRVYDVIQSLMKHSSPLNRLTLLRQLCSSREACYLSLKKHKNFQDQTEHTLTAIEQLPQHAKAKEVVKLIRSIGREKVIIFTEYRATQYFLQHFLMNEGFSVVPFRGGFSRSKKEWMRQLFKNNAQILIATEAGGEGINLQFCHHMINYDLPWNPLRLEQRIGRIHRIGQQHPVNIYNLALCDTIEEHIVQILYEKINLFEGVIGNLDAILETLNINDIEKEIEQIYASSISEKEIEVKMNHLNSIIEQENAFLEGRQ